MQVAFMFIFTASLAGCITVGATFAGDAVLAQSQLHRTAAFASASRQNAASKDAPRLMRADRRTRAEVHAHDGSQQVEVKGNGQLHSDLKAIRTVTLGGFPADLNGKDFSVFNGVFVEMTDEAHLVDSKPTYWEQGNHSYYIFYCKSYDVWAIGAQQFWVENKIDKCVASATTDVGADILSDALVKFQFVWDGSRWQKILGPRVSELGVQAAPTFDCRSDVDDGKYAWSAAKKAYCCEREGIACQGAAAAAASANFTHPEQDKLRDGWNYPKDGDEVETGEEKLKDRLRAQEEASSTTTAAPTNLSADNLTVNETTNGSAALSPEGVNESHSMHNLSNQSNQSNYTTPRTPKEWADALNLTLSPDWVNLTSGPTPPPTDAPTPPPTPPTPAPTQMPTLAPSPDGLPYGWTESNATAVNSTSTNNTTVTTTALYVDRYWWNFTGINKSETVELEPKLLTPTQDPKRIKIA